MDNRFDAHNIKPIKMYQLNKKEAVELFEKELSILGADVKLHLDFDDETGGLMLSFESDWDVALMEDEAAYNSMLDSLPGWFNPEEWFTTAQNMIWHMLGHNGFVAYAEYEIINGTAVNPDDFTAVIEIRPELDKTLTE